VKLHPKELQPYLKNRRITTGTTLTSVAFDSLMHLDADVPFLDSPAKKSKLPPLAVPAVAALKPNPPNPANMLPPVPA
jgi:hypothetical protein